RVLHALEAAGLEAWYVGGWVRDALMGYPSHDVDMCCSGLWQESKAALEAAGIAVVESGIKFGGITAISDGERIEVTTYRLDGFYTDGRHPQSVERAASLEDDLARRDFTVNAMAWHPERGLVDRYDGQGDLKRKLIRAVGDPKRRFDEDALRMLRAVRFACSDFMIEPETKRRLERAPLLVPWRVNVWVLSRGHSFDRSGETRCFAIPSSSVPLCPSWQRVAGLISAVSIMRLTSTCISPVC
ncbi:MAG: CCA tRNA nucleotidyltransferase, partial [Collinsella sp.]